MSGHRITWLIEAYVSEGTTMPNGTPRLKLPPTICGTCRRPLTYVVVNPERSFLAHVRGSKPVFLVVS